MDQPSQGQPTLDQPAPAQGQAAPEPEPARKPRRGRITPVRRIVQFAVLLLFLLPMFVAGWKLFGIAPVGEDAVATPAQLPFFGSLSSSYILGVETLDPFAMLQVALASKTFDPMWLVYALPILIVYGLIRGRAFCGWVCPVNLVLEGVDWLRGKLGLKVAQMPLPRHTKLWVALGVLVLSLLLSVPVFETFNPIGAINKLLLFGSTAGLVTLVAVIVAELFWGRRVWCRSLCPLGGFYEALGKVGQVNVRIDHTACVKCGKCQKACLCDPQILEPAIDGSRVFVAAGDCMLCGKCVDACPVDALGICLGRPKG